MLKSPNATIYLSLLDTSWKIDTSQFLKTRIKEKSFPFAVSVTKSTIKIKLYNVHATSYNSSAGGYLIYAWQNRLAVKPAPSNGTFSSIACIKLASRSSLAFRARTDSSPFADKFNLLHNNTTSKPIGPGYYKLPL